MPVNGPIFVVEREAPSLARYSFLILNRNNIKTLDVEINSDWILEDAETILICQPYRFLPRPGTFTNCRFFLDVSYCA